MIFIFTAAQDDLELKNNSVNDLLTPALSSDLPRRCASTAGEREKRSALLFEKSSAESDRKPSSGLIKSLENFTDDTRHCDVFEFLIAADDETVGENFLRERSDMFDGNGVFPLDRRQGLRGAI